jgi:beta-galactosidase GanA
MILLLGISGGVRGVVWVNGFNLGRYWVVGPQQSLYLPGSVVKAGQEDGITVLELEPRNEKISVRGITERVWENRPDPDAP